MHRQNSNNNGKSRDGSQSHPCKRSHGTKGKTSSDGTQTSTFFDNESSTYKGSLNNSRSSSHRQKRKKHFKDNLQGEFQKAKPPIFYVKVKSSEEVKA